MAGIKVSENESLRRRIANAKKSLDDAKGDCQPFTFNGKLITPKQEHIDENNRYIKEMEDRISRLTNLLNEQ